MAKSTKPTSTTSYRETAFGVLPRLKVVQHRFVWIHPFKDYNGRISRLLTNLILLNLGFPIITIQAETGKDREEYVNAMQAADQQDYVQLERLMASALKESLERA